MPRTELAPLRGHQDILLQFEIKTSLGLSPDLFWDSFFCATINLYNGTMMPNCSL